MQFLSKNILLTSIREETLNAKKAVRVNFRRNTHELQWQTRWMRSVALNFNFNISLTPRHRPRFSRRSLMLAFQHLHVHLRQEPFH